jgi:hypothetical protein
MAASKLLLILLESTGLNSESSKCLFISPGSPVIFPFFSTCRTEFFCSHPPCSAGGYFFLSCHVFVRVLCSDASLTDISIHLSRHLYSMVHIIYSCTIEWYVEHWSFRSESWVDESWNRKNEDGEKGRLSATLSPWCVCFGLDRTARPLDLPACLYYITIYKVIILYNRCNLSVFCNAEYTESPSTGVDNN